ncbi:MAG: penicillin-binding protein activator LpoB [Acidiferrobacterales bacterium]
MTSTGRLFCRLFVVIVATVTVACGTSVERVDTEDVKDLSGAWNDTDSRLVSEQLIEDVLSQSWLRNHTRARGTSPAVIVGDMRNLTHEHINMNTFVADIERAMIDSGKVRFVASRTERRSVRDERRDQDLHASEATRKPMGQEVGADFMLQGTITSVVDVSGSTQIRYYQVDMTLISLADNQKIWVGQKKIKKLVKRSHLRF